MGPGAIDALKQSDADIIALFDYMAHAQSQEGYRLNDLSFSDVTTTFAGVDVAKQCGQCEDPPLDDLDGELFFRNVLQNRKLDWGDEDAIDAVLEEMIPEAIRRPPAAATGAYQYGKDG